jgi:hypothetical protein
MTPSSKIKFRPLPRVYLPYPNGEDIERVKAEIQIADGEVARFLMLPDFFSGYLTVHFDEEDTEGLPGNFFIVKTIGRAETSCGGYIGEHHGPKTLPIWFANRSSAAITLSGAIGIEPIEVIETEETEKRAEEERKRRASAWDERKEMVFEKAMALLPTIITTVSTYRETSQHATINRLRSLIQTLDAPQLTRIMEALDPLQKEILIEIIERLIAGTPVSDATGKPSNE